MIASLLLASLVQATPSKPKAAPVQCVKPATVQECSARLDSLAEEVSFMRKVLETKGIDFAKERQRLAMADSVFAIPHNPALTLGPADAKHTLSVFTDPQCPYCQRLYPQLDAWVAARKDLRIAIHLFPLSFHDRAMPSSKAYWAAGQQKKFDAFFHALHASSTDLSDASLDQAAKTAGMDLERFHQDMASEAAAQAVQSDLALGRHVGVEGTPTLYLDGRTTRDPDADLDKQK